MAVETGISRRKLLKRAGIGGAAAVWSVPFLASTASADVGIETARQGCRNADQSPHCNVCTDSLVCKTKNGKQCFCFAGAKSGISSGCCECQGNISCAQSPPCSSNGNCPSGWKCTFNCCGRTCVPPCGQGIAAGAAGGKTAAGV